MLISDVTSGVLLICCDLARNLVHAFWIRFRNDMSSVANLQYSFTGTEQVQDHKTDVFLPQRNGEV